MGNKQRVINRDVNAALRALEALKLRAAKLTYEEIAHQCGYASPGAARNAILRELNRVIVADVEELRREESAMYDYLQQSILSMAVGSTEVGEESDEVKVTPPNLFAIDRVLAISKSRRELLGIDLQKDAALANVPYTKRIILTHRTVTLEAGPALPEPKGAA